MKKKRVFFSCERAQSEAVRLCFGCGLASGTGAFATFLFMGLEVMKPGPGLLATGRKPFLVGVTLVEDVWVGISEEI